MNTKTETFVIKEKKGWTLADIPWAHFDPSKVDPEIVKVIKAAAMVEYNAHDYAAYLRNVFSDDPAFQKEVDDWSKEEVQHGLALGQWAEKADPSFNFEASFKKFLKGFRINVDAKESIRGSRAGELVARCIVETGTSNFYTAMAEATQEPVLKYICRQIAGDEFRHYRLFYDGLKIYLKKENLNSLDRLRISLGRIAESEDDELAYAYYSANGVDQQPGNDNALNDKKGYNRTFCTNAYTAKAFGCYGSRHIDKMVNMIFKACGLNTQGLLAKTASKLAWFTIRLRHKKAVLATRQVA